MNPSRPPVLLASTSFLPLLHVRLISYPASSVRRFFHRKGPHRTVASNQTLLLLACLCCPPLRQTMFLRPIGAVPWGPRQERRCHALMSLAPQHLSDNTLKLDSTHKTSQHVWEVKSVDRSVLVYSSMFWVKNNVLGLKNKLGHMETTEHHLT